MALFNTVSMRGQSASASASLSIERKPPTSPCLSCAACQCQSATIKPKIDKRPKPLFRPATPHTDRNSHTRIQEDKGATQPTVPAHAQPLSHLSPYNNEKGRHPISSSSTHRIERPLEPPPMPFAQYSCGYKERGAYRSQPAAPGALRPTALCP